MQLLTTICLLALYVVVLRWAWRSEDALYERKPDVSAVKATPCSFCRANLTVFMYFGDVALAGGFLKPDKFKSEDKYPLRLCFCQSCYAVQIAERVPADTLFKDYLYFSSATETIRRHFAEYAREVVDRFKPKTAVEIGCNDGVLMSPMRSAGVRVIGVDPSNTVPTGPDIVNEYFTTSVANRIGKVDMVIANNVFAHIDDIHAVTQAVCTALKNDGVFIIEAHYLGDMIQGLQYDWIYHEHIYYYSLVSLEKHLGTYGLEVFDVKHVDTHGGSMRYYISRRGAHGVTPAVDALRLSELEQGLDRLGTFMEFADRVDRHRTELRDAIGSLNGKVAGYGASGRASAMIQFCDISVDYIVDDAPAKHGFYTPGSHIPIVPRAHFELSPPDHVIVFAWGYADEIGRKCDLPMIVPLPEIRRINQARRAA